MDTVTGVGVLDKAMTVLDAIADSPANLTELQQRTGLPRATAHRLAGALEAHGLVRRDGESRYELGHRLTVLGRLAAERFPLAANSRPVMAELRDETGESVQLFVRDGDVRRCLVSLESTHGLRWIVPEGTALPLGVGSSGRLLDGEPAPRGWIESIGEREPGVASVSVPLRTRDGMLMAALSVSGPVERLSRHPGERFGALLVDAATRIDVG